MRKRSEAITASPKTEFGDQRCVCGRRRDETNCHLCITKTPSSGFPSNVTLLLPGRLLNPASSSLPHVAAFNGISHGRDLRDPQPATRIADMGQRLSYTKLPIETRLFGRLVWPMWTPRLTKLGPKVEGRREHLEDAWRATPTHLIPSALQT